MKICVFNAKGGVGRTTTTLNLAGYYALNPKHRVLVADQDPQGSALAWASLADETPFTVGRSRSPGFDIELLDLPPRIPDNNALPDADIYLVPTLLDGVAFVVFLRTIKLLQEQNKPYIPIANRIHPARVEHQERLASPHLKDALIVRERACLASSYSMGTTIWEMKGRGVRDAQVDIREIAKRIDQRLNTNFVERAK